jgi:hypothetical protein
VEDRPVVEQLRGAARQRFVRDLEKLGPPVSTTVYVNDRSMLLEAAIRLIEQLPEYARLGRRGLRIVVDPDPFATQRDVERGAADPQLVTRLIERQDETDRQAAEEREREPWWEKLKRRLTGRRW